MPRTVLQPRSWTRWMRLPSQSEPDETFQSSGTARSSRSTWFPHPHIVVWDRTTFCWDWQPTRSRRRWSRLKAICSQASCNPLRFAVKHRVRNLNVGPNKKLNIDLLWCTGGGGWSQLYPHTGGGEVRSPKSSREHEGYWKKISWMAF